MSFLDQVNKKIEQLSPLLPQQPQSDSLMTTLLVHCVNDLRKLQCLDGLGEVIEFPFTLDSPVEGVYKIDYKIEGKIIQFRFVDQGDQLLVNFVEKESSTLHQCLLKNGWTPGVKVETYVKVLDSLASPATAKPQNTLNPPRRLQPVPLPQPPFTPHPFEQPGPFGGIPSGIYVNGQPPRNIFGQDEYIGPNHAVFQTRNMVRREMRDPDGINNGPLNEFGQPHLDMFGNQWPQGRGGFNGGFGGGFNGGFGGGGFGPRFH